MEADKRERREKIAVIATQIVASQIKKGEIPNTDEAVQAAMPEAVETARAAYDAAAEFLS